MKFGTRQDGPREAEAEESWPLKEEGWLESHAANFLKRWGRSVSGLGSELHGVFILVKTHSRALRFVTDKFYLHTRHRPTPRAAARAQSTGR